MSLDRSEIGKCLPYKTLPPEQFKIPRAYDDPFCGWLDRRAQRWGPLKGVFSFMDKNAHQIYVGGNAASGKSFSESCRFQLDFMRGVGLSPEDVFLDIGCGCLRAGIHLIPYLAAGKYLGMDISAEAVYRGIVKEIGFDLFQAKNVEVVISDEFDFQPFSKCPRFALANSLFTHLPPSHIYKCLHNLRKFSADAVLDFYATFTEVETLSEHNNNPHYVAGAHQLDCTRRLDYTIEEMHEIGKQTGWHTEYIGAWGHPKNDWDKKTKHQRMFRFSTKEITDI